MHRLFFIIFLLSLSISSQSQDWFPTGSTWHYFAGGFTDSYYEIKVFVSGDTIIEDTSCKILEREVIEKTINTGSDTISIAKSTYGIVYEEDDKAYYYSDDDDFVLLYDFTLDIGDVITYQTSDDETFQMVVQDVGYEEVSGQFLRFQMVKFVTPDNCNTNFTFKFVETVGLTGTTIFGNAGFIHPESFICAFADPPREFMCYANDAIAYPAGQSCQVHQGSTSSTENEELNTTLVISPNPAHSSISFNAKMHYDRIAIYDTSGKLVIEFQHTSNSIDILNLDNGLYFVQFTKDTSVVTRKFIVAKQ